MKLTKSVFSLLLLTGFLLLSCSSKGQEPKFILSKEGIGPITKGVKLADLPAKFEGLYDKIEKEFSGKDIDSGFGSDCYEYSFYLEENETMLVSDYGDGLVIDAFASNISTPDDIHPGMKIEDLLKKEVSYHSHEAILVHGDYNISITFSEIGYKNLTIITCHQILRVQQ